MVVDGECECVQNFPNLWWILLEAVEDGRPQPSWRGGPGSIGLQARIVSDSGRRQLNPALTETSVFIKLNKFWGSRFIENLGRPYVCINASMNLWRKGVIKGKPSGSTPQVYLDIHLDGHEGRRRTG